ncbi:MAG: hypothetical protein ACOCXA_07775 [Planctomycetota bacterium]
MIWIVAPFALLIDAIGAVLELFGGDVHPPVVDPGALRGDRWDV